MAGKPVARLGDAGSHGGVITTGSRKIFVNDKPMARVGDTYDCPKHGPNPIVTGANHVFGQEKLVAHVGSKTACGAIIVEGSPDVFVDVPVPAASFVASTTPRGTYDEQVRVFDRNGDAVKHTPFFIVDGDGNEYKGVTDENGCCPRVYTSTIQRLEIYLGVQALERWPNNV
ncbi:MAG: PAAR domain-containing protein [Desulfovibrio sp.]|nr:PAAR domain-containing protein [Desulfovibrio sp.]